MSQLKIIEPQCNPEAYFFCKIPHFVRSFACHFLSRKIKIHVCAYHAHSIRTVYSLSFSAVRIVATEVEGIVPTSVIAAVTKDEGITSYIILAY